MVLGLDCVMFSHLLFWFLQRLIRVWKRAVWILPLRNIYPHVGHFLSSLIGIIRLFRELLDLDSTGWKATGFFWAGATTTAFGFFEIFDHWPCVDLAWTPVLASFVDIFCCSRSCFKYSANVIPDGLKRPIFAVAGRVPVADRDMRRREPTPRTCYPGSFCVEENTLLFFDLTQWRVHGLMKRLSSCSLLSQQTVSRRKENSERLYLLWTLIHPESTRLIALKQSWRALMHHCEKYSCLRYLRCANREREDEFFHRLLARSVLQRMDRLSNHIVRSPILLVILILGIVLLLLFLSNLVLVVP